MQRTVEYERGGLQKEHYAREDVVTVNCPFCCSDSFQGIYKERGELGVVRCKRCGLLFTNPRLKDPGKVYWGDPGKYFEEARMIFNGTAEHHRDPNYLSDLSVIEKFKPEGNFLDLGTNMGFFLRHTRGKNGTLWGWSLHRLSRKWRVRISVLPLKPVILRMPDSRTISLI